MSYDPVALVLSADSDLLIINKPAGLPTLPDGFNPAAPNLRSVLEEVYGRLWIVHRLDKETSGVMLFARTPSAHRWLLWMWGSDEGGCLRLLCKHRGGQAHPPIYVQTSLIELVADHALGRFW